MKRVAPFAVLAFAALAACEGTRTDENIAAAAEEQAEGMAAQAGNELEAAGDAIASGASKLEAEIDPGKDGADGEEKPAEGANGQ